MTLWNLVFDPSGPYGISREMWWTLFTAGLLGGLLPLVWRLYWVQTEKRRWQPLRSHLGVMLSWNHGDLGKALHGLERLFETPTKALEYKFDNELDKKFAKILNELGLYSSVIASDSVLARILGNYIDDVNRLWWWLDWKYKFTDASIPDDWESDDLITSFRRVNQSFEQAMERLGTPKKLVRGWEIDNSGIVAIRGDTLK